MVRVKAVCDEGGGHRRKSRREGGELDSLYDQGGVLDLGIRRNASFVEDSPVVCVYFRFRTGPEFFFSSEERAFSGCIASFAEGSPVVCVCYRFRTGPVFFFSSERRAFSGWIVSFAEGSPVFLIVNCERRRGLAGILDRNVKSKECNTVTS